MAPAICAHRGGNELHRAQTLAAFAAAAVSGVEYVEFDVRRLADGALVCFHDADVDGVPLRRMSYEDLCVGAGYEVPHLGAVLPIFAGRVTAHVDLKETGHEPSVVRMALDLVGDEFIVTSLVAASLRAIRHEFPAVRTALSLGRGLRGVVGDLFPVRRIHSCGADWTAIDRNLAPWGVLRRCARAGVPAMVWTVDDEQGIDRYLTDPRVAVLVTNRPLHALARRRALYGV